MHSFSVNSGNYRLSVNINLYRRSFIKRENYHETRKTESNYDICSQNELNRTQSYSINSVSNKLQIKTKPNSDRSHYIILIIILSLIMMMTAIINLIIIVTMRLPITQFKYYWWINNCDLYWDWFDCCCCCSIPLNMIMQLNSP